METALYRIVQEALTNTVKHAQARNVSILFTWRDGRAVAVIEDDGRGFDRKAETKDSDCSACVSGSRCWTATSSWDDPGGGTTLVAEVPVA